MRKYCHTAAIAIGTKKIARVCRYFAGRCRDGRAREKIDEKGGRVLDRRRRCHLRAAAQRTRRNQQDHTPVALNREILRGDTRLTQRWSHGEIHDYLPGMNGHVVMTFYGAAQGIAWRSGAARQTSRTRPGSITLIPDGHDGHWNIGGPLEVSHVYLTEQRLQNCADLLANGRRVELLDRVAFDDQATSHILQMLSQPSVANDPASRLFVEQAVDLLCTQLIRAHSSIGTLQDPPRRGLADWQVKRVTAYMQDFIDREIGLEEMASLVGLSQFHFCTAFRLATGMSPHHYLTALRMTRARKLLAEPSLSII